jgi:spore maturation protein CgeB
MGPRLQISDGLRRIMSYRKFVGTTRMLVLETGYFFERSWLRAGEQLGWKVASAPSAMVGGVTRDDIAALFTVLGEFKPHFIMASNFAGMDVAGMFGRFFHDLEIPYVSWFTDTPRMILYEREVVPSPFLVAATWERAYEGHLRSLGFEHVLYLPLATDPVLFSGSPRERCARDLAFVGTSMVEQSTEARESLADNPELLRCIDEAFAEGRVTRGAFGRGFEEILGEAVVSALNARDRRHAELYVVYESTRRDREAMVRRMAPLGLEVRGDDAWAGIAARAGGAVGYFQDLGPYYRDTAVNLNVTSLQMASAVNQRVFDCPAAGGFVLSDAQGDLGELFARDEVETYGTLEELEEKAAFFVRRPEARIPVVARAQRRVLAEHTHRHRLETVVEFLKREVVGEG